MFSLSKIFFRFSLCKQLSFSGFPFIMFVFLNKAVSFRSLEDGQRGSTAHFPNMIDSLMSNCTRRTLGVGIKGCDMIARTKPPSFSKPSLFFFLSLIRKYE